MGVHPCTLCVCAVAGVIRAEKLEAPEDVIPSLLERVKTAHIRQIYNIPTWTDSLDLLSQLALKNGRLHKGGEPDVVITARSIIFDWQRGKIPYYALPPGSDESRPVRTRGAKDTASGVVQVEQKIPRLGAHELLADEEEVDDRAQVPVTCDPEDGEGEDDADMSGEGKPDIADLEFAAITAQAEAAAALAAEANKASKKPEAGQKRKRDTAAVATAAGGSGDVAPPRDAKRSRTAAGAGAGGSKTKGARTSSAAATAAAHEDDFDAFEM